MKNLVIIGAGGCGRETAEIAKTVIKEKGDLKLLGFIDDNTDFHGKIMNQVPVLGGLDWIKEAGNGNDVYFVCAIGEPRVKKKVADRAENLGYIPYTLIHPSVTIDYDVTIGTGTILFPGTMITTNISIGNHVLINRMCSIGHDVVIEDYVTVNPLSAISGNVTLKEGVFIGTGAAVIQGIEIGEWSVIGASAGVIRNQDAYVLAVGVPTEVKKKPDQ